MLADEQRAPAVHEPASWKSGGIDPSNLAQLQRLARKAPATKRTALTEAMATVELIANYTARKSEIEAAGHALEAHRAEFEALLQDEQACLERARRLFAEEAFAPLRFLAADIQRAFSTVGYPMSMTVDEERARTVREAILFLASDRERHSFALRLLLLLPDYVAAGRPLDAWLIQECAFLTAESPKESNPFLFEMFCHGVAEWDQQRNAEDASLLRKLGVDQKKLRAMGVDGVEDWLATQMADPKKTQRLEAFLDTHPEMRGALEANCIALERESARLLEREDAGALLLSPEEIKTWSLVIEQRFLAKRRKFGFLAKGVAPDEAEKEAAGKLLVSVLRKMSQAIFTPSRVEQLTAALRDYRRKLLAANENEATHLANGALLLLQRETDPAQNYFLISLCDASLRSMAHATDQSQPHTSAGSA